MEQLAKEYKLLVRNAWRLFSLSHRSWLEPMESHGLNTSTYPVLEVIVQNPGVMQQEITDMLSIDKSCTSRACKYLEAYDFIRKEKSLSSSHAFRCFPTEKACTVVNEILALESIQIQKMFEGENPEELERSNRLLAHLLERL